MFIEHLLCVEIEYKSSHLVSSLELNKEFTVDSHRLQACYPPSPWTSPVWQCLARESVNCTVVLLDGHQEGVSVLQSGSEELGEGETLLIQLLSPHGLACPVCFFTLPRTTCPGGSTTHSELSPPTITIKHLTSFQSDQSGENTFSIEVPSIVSG